jgi:hypothetical protein
MKINMNDLLVAFNFKNPDVIEGIDIFEKNFQFQKNFFKYKKPEYGRSSFNGTKEEAEALYSKIMFNKDPTKPLNMLRRLPLFFNYTIFENYNLNFLKQNFLVFYNFLKAVLVAFIFLFFYFVYTVFFFKIQFLKQIST